MILMPEDHGFDRLGIKDTGRTRIRRIQTGRNQTEKKQTKDPDEPFNHFDLQVIPSCKKYWAWHPSLS